MEFEHVRIWLERKMATWFNSHTTNPHAPNIELWFKSIFGFASGESDVANDFKWDPYSWICHAHDHCAYWDGLLKIIFTVMVFYLLVENLVHLSRHPPSSYQSGIAISPHPHPTPPLNWPTINETPGPQRLFWIIKDRDSKKTKTSHVIPFFNPLKLIKNRCHWVKALKYI